MITGTSGFVGSHILEHLLINTDWNFICPASWSHKGTPERILESKHYQANKDRVEVITHDLTAPFTAQTLKRFGDIDYIVHVASESHVDRSITDPVPFVRNNVDIQLTMLELARKLNVKKFIHFSTDEVYGAAPEGVSFKEWSPILPSNPYAASKAAQEAIAISYWRTYNTPVIITNCMNLFGERQDTEKYLAMCIRKIKDGETITVHGNEKYIGKRHYIHARNCADSILFILNEVEAKLYTDGGEVDRPERFNIVGEVELDNLQVAQAIADVLGKELKYELVDFHNGRPGHDRRYALDGSKLKDYGWKQPTDFNQSLKQYVEWTLNNKNWL